MAENGAEEILGPDPDDLVRSQTGHLASVALEFIGDLLLQQEIQIVNEVLRALKQTRGKLEPDLAVQSWLQIAATRRLRESLLSEVRKGGRAGKRIQSEAVSRRSG